MKPGLIHKTLDNISGKLGHLASWAAVMMVIVMVTIVVLRYLFQFGSIALQESVIYINGLLFTFGVAYTLREQGHVRVDIFYNGMSPSRKALVNALGTLLFLVPSCVFIIYISWDYVALSWRVREGSAEASGLPFVYLLKTCILVLPALLFMQGVSELLKALPSLGLLPGSKEGAD